RDTRIKRGKNKVAIEIRREILHNQVASSFRNRRIEMPFHNVGVSFPRRALRGCEIRQLKPRMVCQYVDEALTDHSGRAEDTGAELFFKSLGWSAHASPLCEFSFCILSTFGPILVPRNSGLKVLRTQTTISVSAASGSTSTCNTFAPD